MKEIYKQLVIYAYVYINFIYNSNYVNKNFINNG